MAVKGERTNVGFLVLFLLLHAFLELTVLLEAVLLGHLTTFLVTLDLTTLRAEHLHLAIKQLVLAELTFQRAVEQRNLDAWLQAYLVETLLTVTQHPGIVARELMLQPLTYHFIGTQQVGRRDAFAVRWIGHHDALLLRLLEVLEVLLLHRDAVGQPGCLHVQASRVDGLHVDVVAVDMVFELPLLRVVIVDAVEEVGIEVGPLFEGILLAEQAGCHILGNESSLHKQGTRAAHGVDEVGIAIPSCQQNHAGCQHLVQRSFYRLLTITATVERLTAGVERQGTLVFCNMNVQPQVRIGHRNIRTATHPLAELVDDGILHLVAHELRVAELLREHNGIDGKRLVLADVLRPVDFSDFLIDVVRTLGLEVTDGF